MIRTPPSYSAPRSSVRPPSSTSASLVAKQKVKVEELNEEDKNEEEGNEDGF